MFFQSLEEKMLMAYILTPIVVGIIMIFIGTLITRWWAMKKEWGDSWKSPLIINLIWGIGYAIIYISFSFMEYGNWFAMLLSIIFNLIIGALLASKLYEKTFGEAIIFIIIVVIIIFIISFILYIIVQLIIITMILGTVIIE